MRSSNEIAEGWEDLMEWDSDDENGPDGKTEVHVVHTKEPAADCINSLAAVERQDSAAAQSYHKTSSRRVGKQAQDPQAYYNSHNLVEKRYRANLNKKIVELGDAVPCLRLGSMRRREKSSVGKEPEPQQKVNKATVLSKAIEYIHELETRNRLLQQDNLAMNQYVNSIKHQAAVTDINEECDSSHNDPEQVHQAMAASTTSIRGMIQVPPEFLELHRHRLQSQYVEPAFRGRKPSDGGSDVGGEVPLGKLHVGSLVL